MDPVKRTALKARRLQHTIAFIDNHFLKGPFSLRPAISQSSTKGLRQAITSRVQAFVLPAPPLATAEAECSDVLAELRSPGILVAHGSWTINARVRALSSAETRFVVGFSVNDHRYFAFMLGALNFPNGSSRFSSPTDSATVTLSGVSNWLGNNFETACREGVTFRLRASTEGASARALVQSWLTAFPAPLHRPMSLLDEDRDIDAWGVPPGTGQLLEGDAGSSSSADSPGLSFEVALRFD